MKQPHCVGGRQELFSALQQELLILTVCQSSIEDRRSWEKLEGGGEGEEVEKEIETKH